MKASWLIGLALLSASAQATELSYWDQASLNQSLRNEAKFGKLARLEALIMRGADVNGEADYGETALFYSVLFGHPQAVRFLLQKGANPNKMDHLDRGPLHRAAEDCNFKTVEDLLNAGAKIDAADFFGRTPLMEAVESNCVRATAVILRRGLKHGRMTLNLDAQDNSFRGVDDYPRHPWIIEMLKVARERGELPKDFLSKIILK